MATSLSIPDSAIRQYLADTNPWWTTGQGIDERTRSWPRRAYFAAFVERVQAQAPRRAVVLIGPRRVGKTVMLMQTIQHLLDAGVAGTQLLYAQMDAPLFMTESLDSLVRRFIDIHRHPPGRPLWVLFDEVQYLKDWQTHLKVLVDTHRHVQMVATGSAAAALRMGSRESGAGRFSDFVLPPLTFAEYLDFSGQEGLIVETADAEGGRQRYTAINLGELNGEFVNYLNYGGFPEAVVDPTVRADPRRFLKQDIVDKVLQKDLPSLFGIADTQMLNRFFHVLAFHSGHEVSPDSLAKTTGIKKHVLAEYLEYLEAAFLIRRVHRIDDTARRLQRMRTFKVYLTNPSMRAALFGLMHADHEAMGSMAETAIWSQWLHSTATIESLHYARWKEGRTDLEVDLVGLDGGSQKPRFAVEIKWSDAAWSNPHLLRGLRSLATRHRLVRPPLATTRTEQGAREVDGQMIEFAPCSVHCYTIARNLLRSLS
jgi:predicted AAA+ superfamily ATPase